MVPLRTKLSFALWIATSSVILAEESTGFLVRMEYGTTQWQAWITAPHLWNLAALPPSTLDWRIEALCPAETTVLQPINVTIATIPAWEVLVCIDRSAAASLSPFALRRVVEALGSTLRPADRLVLVQYRYRAEALHTFLGPQTDPSVTDTLTILPPAGIAAPLHILQGALEYCRNSPSLRQRALVLVTEASGEASFLVGPGEVIQSAQQLAIPISVVQIGTLNDRSFWRTIATQTGGIYIWVDTADPNTLGRYLTWFTRGLQTHYALSFPAPRGCARPRLQFRADQWKRAVEHWLGDSLLPLVNSLSTVCLFEAGDTTVTPEYESVLNDLAHWLRAHPRATAELIGHSGQSEGLQERLTLALRRAQAVRRRLLQLGVAPHQLRLRSEGSQRPIFYFEQTPEQQRLNRRVELRWLHPEQLPHELLAGTVVSEDRALYAVKLWASRGYAAYFEPIVHRGGPAYRIKLWGFATADQAERARRHIWQRYRTLLRRW
ncbi:MAG: OmpA family protein [Bacteroidota bacterium]|nr:OmpA family protein [Bacteroidota bacterium]